nr:Hachiman antiphage defense system protein HamA [uncultured Flavobacterium sp.]
MGLLQHFEKSKINGFTLYKLRDIEWQDFIDKLPNDYRVCYISNKKLSKLSTKIGVTASEYLEKYILPENPTIKSGDFGEILSYYSVIENFENNGFVFSGPLKWRWKDKEKAAQYADAILFHIADDTKFTKDDHLVTIESKMKSVKSNKHRIQDAIDGATDDKLSRLAKTINWLEEKYAKKGNAEQVELVKRFKDPVLYGTYNKTHKAIAIIDNAFETEELSKGVNNPENVVVIVFSMKDLKKIYEETHDNIKKIGLNGN